MTFEVGDVLQHRNAATAALNPLRVVYAFPGLAYYTQALDHTAKFMLLTLNEAWDYDVVAKTIPTTIWHELDIIGNPYGSVAQILWRGRQHYMVTWLAGEWAGKRQTRAAVELNVPSWRLVRGATRERDMDLG